NVSSRDQRKEDAQRRQAQLEKKRPLKKEIDQIENQLAALETERDQLHAQLLTPMQADAIAQAGRRLKEVEETLAELELRWMDLSETLQALEHNA
ncbi:MAG: hypothetical protein RLZZ24_373, partial [Pseudomonadota bacterium]